jgi:hypothetical protein
MSTTNKNHALEAISDAKDTVREFIDEIVTSLIETGEASNDLFNDYPNGDAYHHEYHVDKEYSLVEAGLLLDRLSDFEETDEGLWDGLEPRQAISCQAAYTYGNAVMYYWGVIIDEINADPILTDALEGHEEGDTEANRDIIKQIVLQITDDY